MNIWRAALIALALTAAVHVYAMLTRADWPWLFYIWG